MKKADVERLEKLIGQLEGVHKEIALLARKSPNDAVNNFKLSLVNTIIVEANELLGDGYRPFSDFTTFDKDDVPSNSDVTFILAQYLEEIERMRADNITAHGGMWFYDLDDSDEDIRTAPPAKVQKK